ncbi:MAG: FKBP-type peptidyl-prolyl cis-trans isomerase [Candidatus Eiseniibacteriota bacterium]
MAQQPKRMGVEYTVYLADGAEIDGNVGKSVLSFQPGQSEILPVLEREIVALQRGESKRITLSPDDAYGPVRPEAFHEVAASELPDEALEIGTELIAEDEEGNEQTIRVHEIRGDRVVLDFNHPLAGQTLVYEVRVVEIE